MKCSCCSDVATVVLYKKIYDDRYGYPGTFSLLHCKTCGSFHTDPPLSEHEVARLYTDYYGRKPGKKAPGGPPEAPGALRGWLTGNHRVQYLLPRGSGKVLEIGCGRGETFPLLRALGYEPSGIEADRNVAQSEENIHIGSIEDALHSAGTFDVIFGNQLLEHIIEPEAFLSRVRLLLKGDGVAIFATPNAGSLYRRLLGRRWINWHIPYHQHLYTPKGLRLLFEKNGFTIEHIKTVTPYSWNVHQAGVFLSLFPKKGKRSAYWTGPAPKHPLLLRILLRLVFLALVPFNRLIDTIGWGDSIIIWVRPR